MNAALMTVKYLKSIFNTVLKFPNVMVFLEEHQMVFFQCGDIGQIQVLEVEGDGKNLSSDSTASPTFLKILDSTTALEGYERGIYTETEYFFLHGQHFGIVSPPSTAGSSSIRLTYEAFAADLVNDTDEPLLPKTYHSLICYRAAIALRETMDLDTVGLERIARRKEVRFMAAMNDMVADYDGQMYVSGLNNTKAKTVHGYLSES